MTYWLIKSEPSVYSWSRLLEDRRTHWDGVRNHQAAKNLRDMKEGDKAFFYHSNDGKEIVGIVEVVKKAYPDPVDSSGRFVMVDVCPIKTLKNPVTLQAIKADPRLKNFQLVRQSRLSVCHVSETEWRIICDMGQ